MDVIDEVTVEAPSTKTDSVQAAESCRVAGYETERQNILREACAAAHHRVATYATELVHQHTGTQDGIVVNDYLACKLGAVADDATVTHNGIVCHMCPFHEQVVVTNYGAPFGCRSSVDGHVLAYLVVVANFGCTFLAFELKVLRNGTDDCTRKENVAIANASAIEHRHTIHQCIVVANDYTLVYITERTYLAILTDNGFWMYVC